MIQSCHFSMSELSPRRRAVIIALSEERVTQKEIARRVRCSQSCVSKIIKRNKEQGSPSVQARSGRPRKTTKAMDRRIVRECQKNRQSTSTEIRNQLLVPVSTSTVRRRLIAVGLRARRPKKKPLLTSKMRKARLAWAKEHESKDLEFWKSVIFSDESRFNVGRNDAVQYVRRRSGEAYKQRCLVPTVKHPQAIMVWGCFSWYGVGRLHLVEQTMNAKQYIKVLEDRLIGTIRDHFNGDVESCFFQDDSAPCHRAKSVS